MVKLFLNSRQSSKFFHEKTEFVNFCIQSKLRFHWGQRALGKFTVVRWNPPVRFSDLFSMFTMAKFAYLCSAISYPEIRGGRLKTSTLKIPTLKNTNTQNNDLQNVDSQNADYQEVDYLKCLLSNEWLFKMPKIKRLII